MKNRIIYVSMFASFSILLISSIMFSNVEAKTFDKESEFVFKGLGLSLFGHSSENVPFSLQISPLDNTKELIVSYVNVDGSIMGLNCHAPKQILKTSGTIKASAEFNTVDLSNCAFKQGGNSKISVNIIGNGQVTEVDNDYEDCIRLNDVDYCTRIHGKTTNYIGIATMTGFGTTFIDDDALIRDLNVKTTYWTNP